MRPCWTTILTALTLTAVAATGRAGNLDRALIDRAGQLLEEVSGAEQKTVGVLPFRIKKGSRYVPAPLARAMAGRLENALIVVQGSTERNAIRVLRECGELSPSAGREALAALFTAERDLAWGGGKAKPDVLFTGEVSCGGDHTSAMVTVELLDAKSWRDGKPAPRRLVRFKVDADVALLRDLGYSFSLPRSALKRKARPADADTLAAAKVERDERSRVTPDNVGGMRLEVEYDGVRQKIVAGPNGLRMPAAKPGQKVVLYLTRVAEDEGKLAAVVRVGGLSLFEEQDGDPADGSKWTYDVKRRGLREDFTGFYARVEKKLTRSQPFRGLSGWLDLDVFGGPVEPRESGISTRSLTTARARTLKELQARLARANHLSLRHSVVLRGGVLLLEVEPAKSTAPEQPLTLPLGGLTVWVGEE